MVSYGNADNASVQRLLLLQRVETDFTGTSCRVRCCWLAAVLRSAFGVAFGFLNPTALSARQLGCNDVTKGNNDPADGTMRLSIPQVAGWDACTGWGSIDGTKLLNGIAGLMYNQTFYFGIGKDIYGLDEVQNVSSRYPRRSG